VKQVQLPFAALKPSATFQIGATADWVLVTDDSVWAAGSKPFSLQRIDPTTNKVLATVPLPGEACSGLVSAFGSVWVPLCGKQPSMARVDIRNNQIGKILPIGPAGPEGGVAASADSIWIVTDAKGILSRIDPSTNTEQQKVSIPPGSYNPIFSDGKIWITGFDSNMLVVVDASAGRQVASIPVGPKPRFVTAGTGSVWTLNQGDGTVTRVDMRTKKVIATIETGTPGPGGDICYGAGSVWTTVFDIPLTRIDPRTNKAVRQWVGQGGDSMRAGYQSIWLTDYRRGLLWRFPYAQLVH
jgi:virginiamycin B lyase